MEDLFQSASDSGSTVYPGTGAGYGGLCAAAAACFYGFFKIYGACLFANKVKVALPLHRKVQLHLRSKLHYQR